jgi:DNA helicase-2/ATP-dependent DNA helicase PcrA
VRDRGRQTGRRVEYRTVSRTLLVKGLEFDHAIVLNADAHNRSNLYVALTRGSRSLTVLSSGVTVSPG